MSANDVSFYGYNLPCGKIVDCAAYLIDHPDEFVAYHHWNRDRLLCPRVPVIYMYIRAADRRPLDANQDIRRSNFGDLNLLEVEAGLRPAFYKGPHNFTHGVENRCVPKWRNPLLVASSNPVNLVIPI